MQKVPRTVKRFHFMNHAPNFIRNTYNCDLRPDRVQVRFKTEQLRQWCISWEGKPNRLDTAMTWILGELRTTGIQLLLVIDKVHENFCAIRAEAGSHANLQCQLRYTTESIYESPSHRTPSRYQDTSKRTVKISSS